MDERAGSAAGGALRREVCGRCGGSSQSGGTVELREGGTTGGWKLLFGELAELGEGLLRVDLYACNACRHVEFYLA